jgi:hypothetical protein
MALEYPYTTEIEDRSRHDHLKTLCACAVGLTRRV